MPSIVPFDEARDKRFNELMDVRRTNHGRVLGSQTNYLKARGQNIQEELANERFAIQRQTLELSRTKELTQMLKQRAAIEMQVQTQQHTVKALETLGKLDPSTPDYHLKLAEVFHDNPLAAKDPLIQDIVKSQITARHVQETTAAEITRHEEAQASEFSRLHGVDVMRDPETGRVDWGASMKNADAALKERNRLALEDVDQAVLKPFETKVTDGKVSRTFKAPTPEKPLPPDVITTKTTPVVTDVTAPIVTTTKTVHVPAGTTPPATGGASRFKFDPTTQSLVPVP